MHECPNPGPPRPADQALLARVDEALTRTGELISGCRFRAAIRESLALARETNRYLDIQSPWHALTTDPVGCATTLYTALNAIDGLKLLFGPFIPFTSERLHRQLGHSDTLVDQGWQVRRIPIGQRVGQTVASFPERWPAPKRHCLITIINRPASVAWRYPRHQSTTLSRTKFRIPHSISDPADDASTNADSSAPMLAMVRGE